MGWLAIWKRLLWKESREGRWVVALAILAPPICFPLGGRYQFDSWERALFVLPAAAGVHLAIALWAAGRGGSKKAGSEFAWTHLPVNPVAEWMASLVVPVITTGLLGLWFGYWASSGAIYSEKEWMAPAGALDLATTYLVCYLISAVVSSWAAVLFGAFRVVAGTLISPWNMMPILTSDAVGFVARTAVGAAAGSFLFVLLSQKRSLAFRQGTSLVLMLVIIFAPAAADLNIRSLLPKEASLASSGGYVRSQGGASYVVGRRAKETVNVVRFRSEDIRSQRELRHDFKEVTRALGLTDDGRAYLAQQVSRGDKIHILEWDTRTDRVTTRAEMPVGGDALANLRIHEVSPDGKYLLISLGSLIGNAEDLWLVNLETGTSTVVIACGSFLITTERTAIWPSQVAWLKDRAIMSGPERAEVLDFRTLTVRPLDISMGGGG